MQCKAATAVRVVLCCAVLCRREGLQLLHNQLAAWACLSMLFSNSYSSHPALYRALTFLQMNQHESCRLAASDSLDEHAPFSVGVPSWLRESSDPGPGHNYFFMHIRPVELGSPRQPPLYHGSGLQYGPRLMGPSPIPNLVLGPLLGKVGGKLRMATVVQLMYGAAVCCLRRAATVVFCRTLRRARGIFWHLLDRSRGAAELPGQV